MLGIIIGNYMIPFTTKQRRIGIIGIILAVFITLVIFLIYVLGVFGWILEPVGGANTKEMVTKQYVEGLKNNNAAIIRILIPPTHNAEEIIKTKLEQFQGANFDKIKVNYNEDFSLIRVEIKEIQLRDGNTTSDEIYVSRNCKQAPGAKECKKWYLIMGDLKEKYKPVIPLK